MSRTFADEFEEGLDALFAEECIGADDHDPAPCAKCERMKARVRELAGAYAACASSSDMAAAGERMG